MAPLKKPAPKPQEAISTERAVKAGVITFLSLVLLVLWGYHALWAAKVMINKTYGSFFNNLVFGVGTLIANAGISIRFMTFLNERILGDEIDADHKKYI